MECKKCSRSLRNESGIRCNGLCGKFFHEKCSGLTDYERNLLITKKNIVYVCDECIESGSVLSNKINEILKAVEENKIKAINQECELKKILEKISSLNNESLTVTGESNKLSRGNVENRKETYAGKLRSEPPVVIKSKSKQTCAKTKEDLKNKVDPCGLKINGVQDHHNGVVTILCESEHERKKVRDVVEANLSDKYEIKIPKLRKPKVYICGIKEEMEETQVENKLRLQNDFLKNSEIKCFRIKKINKGGGKSDRFNAIVELDSESFRKVISVGKVNIGWDRCKVYEETTVKRCFKCQGFNHKAKECTNIATCARCTESHEGM